MSAGGRTRVREARLRRIIVDIGAVSARRHAIPAWFEVDVTDVLPRLRTQGVSVTLYVVATLARAVARHPRLHGCRDLRGGIVIFEDVDVNLSVEVEMAGRSFPMNHVLRRAQVRSPAELTAEVREVVATPSSSGTNRLLPAARVYLVLPGFLRRRLLGMMRRLPGVQQRAAGTVGVTSVGMFGRGGGVGLPFLVHTLDVLVGGMQERPGYGPDGKLARRSYLSLSVVADHDVVDGAPLARFLAELRTDLETGSAL